MTGPSRNEISPPPREYELITEAHAQLSVIRNCSRFSLPVYCLPQGEENRMEWPSPRKSGTLAGGGALSTSTPFLTHTLQGVLSVGTSHCVTHSQRWADRYFGPLASGLPQC
jgi:hypothetical protein